MITGIDHIVLCVGDVERSVEWYRHYLGLVAERLDEWRAGEARPLGGLGGFWPFEPWFVAGTGHVAGA